MRIEEDNPGCGRRRPGRAERTQTGDDDAFEADGALARGRMEPRREARGWRRPDFRTIRRIGPDVVEVPHRYSVPTCSGPAARSTVDSRSDPPGDPSVAVSGRKHERHEFARDRRAGACSDVHFAVEVHLRRLTG